MPPSARTRTVGIEEARRIAVRAQPLDGSATGVLDTVRRLGFLQLDPIATVAVRSISSSGAGWGRTTPPSSTGCSGSSGSSSSGTPSSGRSRRCRCSRRGCGAAGAIRPWERRHRPSSPRTRVPALRPRASSRRAARSSRASSRTARARRARPPLVRQPACRRDAPALHDRGEIAIVGRRGGQRLWDIAERWYPETERCRCERPTADWPSTASAPAAYGSSATGGTPIPDAEDGPVPDRVDAALAVRPVDRRPRPGRGALRLPLSPRDVRPAAKREYGYYVLPILAGDRLVGRAEPRFDRAARTLEVLGAWGDTSGLDEALDRLAAWLGARRV